jgi:ParB family chromosome partitioning protein
MEKKLGRGLERLFSVFKEPPIKAEMPPEDKPLTTPEKIRPSIAEILAPKAVDITPADTALPPKTATTMQADASSGTVLMLRADQLIPNRFQPRKIFDKASLTDLMESIKSAGVLQPILVRKSGNYYEIVAGERRWRACVELHVSVVPVIVKDVDDQKMLEWALIENTQRKDLNPIERARAYKELMTFFNLTQEEIAGRVGLDRATVANFIRLLDLPSEVQDELAKETISTTHARGLLALSDPALQIKLCHRIKNEGMSVRRLEYIIRWLKRRKSGIQVANTQASLSNNPHIRGIEEGLMAKFNTKVSVYTMDNKQGKIMISFYSLDDFQRILDKLKQVQ